MKKYFIFALIFACIGLNAMQSPINDSIIAQAIDAGVELMGDPGTDLAILESWLATQHYISPSDHDSSSDYSDAELALLLQVEENEVSPHATSSHQMAHDIALAQQLQDEETDAKSAAEAASLALALQLQEEEGYKHVQNKDAKVQADDVREIWRKKWEKHQQGNSTPPKKSCPTHKGSPTTKDSSSHTAQAAATVITIAEPQMIMAVKQTDGATCGIHALANAYAVNRCLTTGQQLTPQNIQAQHGEIYHLVKPRTPVNNNLSNDEIATLAKKTAEHCPQLGNNIFFLGNHKDHGLCMSRKSLCIGTGDQVAPLVQMEHTVRKTITKHGSIHFTLNTGGHWVLLSVIKTGPTTYTIIFLDSGNSQAVLKNTFFTDAVAQLKQIIAG